MMASEISLSAKSHLRVLFLDLNSYFASAEQHDRPHLRDKPVAVAAVMTPSTCCLAASREAKRFGIKTGTPVGEAMRLCPSLIVVPSRTELYLALHHQVLAAVDTCIPIEKVWSIDEMECKLLRDQCEPKQALALAHKVKRAIATLVGPTLTCSIGLAPNRILAKLATDMQKPDGLVCIRHSDLPDILFPLKLTDLIGIGARMERRLNQQGIYTVTDLCSRPKADLVRAWGGIGGADWWHWLRGDEVHTPPTHRRSIGHEHVLPPELRSHDDARAVIGRLIYKAGTRLRREDYLTGCLTIHIRLMNGRGAWDDQLLIEPPCRDTLTLLHALSTMWSRIPATVHAMTPFKVGITLTHLIPRHEATLPLFHNVERSNRLADTMDRINTRYGQNALYAASMHRAAHSAPARIAFSSVPLLEDCEPEPNTPT